MIIGFRWRTWWDCGERRSFWRPSVALCAGRDWESHRLFAVTLYWAPKTPIRQGYVFFTRRLTLLRGPSWTLFELHPWTWWLPVRPIIHRARLVAVDIQRGRWTWRHTFRDRRQTA
ncbi:MAG TPA: hypothetical protein VGG29_20900 [Caulobacteraceae bacterium]|jgi:hypothetical protein